MRAVRSCAASPMICSGCIGFGCCGLDAVSRRCSTSSAPRDVALLDRVRELVRRDATGLAEVRRDVVGRRAARPRHRTPTSTSTIAGCGRRPRRGAQRRRFAASGAASTPCPRRASASTSSVFSLLGRRAPSALASLSALASAGGSRAAAGDEARARVVSSGSARYRTRGSTSAAARLPDVAEHDDAPRGHERRALRRVQHGADDRGSARLGAARPRVASSPPAARPGTRELLERERAVVVAERARRPGRRRTSVAQDRVVALDEVHAHADAAPDTSAVRASRIASTMRHTCTDPGDVVHPHDAAAVRDAVRDRRERHVAPLVDVEARAARRGTACSTPTAAACSRERRARRSRAAAPRSAPASCRGRGRRRARSARGASPAASARRPGRAGTR